MKKMPYSSLTDEDWAEARRAQLRDRIGHRVSDHGYDNGRGKDRDSGPAPAPPIGEPLAFKLEDWNDITFDPNDEWLVEDVLPRRGFGLIYGEKQSLKSFVAMNLALSVSLGAAWAGKRVEQGAVVYLAAEGAPGQRKRIAGLKMKVKDVPRGQFALMSVTPNLGTRDGDLPALIAAVEKAGVKPVFIIIDTAAASMGGADENGVGMAAFAYNATLLAQHFDCLVLGVHHVGHDEANKKRPRGWSGLGGALDVQILCERYEDEKRVRLTVQKLKDEEHGICFEARLSRVVVGKDKHEKEASTLVVDEVVMTQKPATPIDTSKDVGPIMRHAFLDAYDRLADAFPVTHGFNGKSVRKVPVNAIRDALRDRGLLETDDSGAITGGARSNFSKAKTILLGKQTLMEDKKLIWRPN